MSKVTVSRQSVPPRGKWTRSAKIGQYLGTTKDGVKIIRPSKAPTNFTVKEIREAVANALSKNAQ
jgi:hypothetical protein